MKPYKVVKLSKNKEGEQLFSILDCNTELLIKKPKIWQKIMHKLVSLYVQNKIDKDTYLELQNDLLSMI